MLPRSVAIEAAERVNGTKFLGRRIRIKLKLSHDSPSIIVQERNRNGWAQIHFSFITHQVTHAIGEEVIDRVLSNIGAIADVAIKQHTITLDPPRQTAYGFIFYYELEAAQRAIQEMKHVQIDGVMFDCNWSNQRDADADARRKLLARQQKPVVPPATMYQSSPQYAPARRSHSSSPVMSGLGYDLSMAMGGLSMGPAGLTMSQQPMSNSMSGVGMYGPRLPPSPIGFGMNSMADSMNMGGMNYRHHQHHQQAVGPPSPQQYHAQHQHQQGGGIYFTGSYSPQGAANMAFFPPQSQMSSGSTDSFASYSNSTGMRPESSTSSSIATMDGLLLQQRGMYMVAPPQPQGGMAPRYHHHGSNPYIPHAPAHHSPPAVYGMNMSRVGVGRGYMPDGIASSDHIAPALDGGAGGGYYVANGSGVANNTNAQSSLTPLSSSPPR